MGKNRSMAQKMLKVKQEDSKRIKESAYNQMCGSPMPEFLKENLRIQTNYGTYKPSITILRERQNNIASQVLNGTISRSVAESELQKMQSNLSLIDCVTQFLVEQERKQNAKKIRLQEINHAI